MVREEYNLPLTKESYGNALRFSTVFHNGDLALRNFFFEFDLENLFVLNGRSCNAFRTESDAKITADHRKNLDQYESKKIAQGYLCTEPVVRIRRSNDDYYLTYKGDGLMVREEYNLPLTKESYGHLLPKIDGLFIAKTRYLFPLNEHLTAELDIFEKDLAPLTLVEVEFDSVEEADKFTAPDWFGEDVTNSGKYHNSYLSRHGLR